MYVNIPCNIICFTTDTNRYIEQKVNSIEHRDATEAKRELKNNLEQKVSGCHRGSLA